MKARFPEYLGLYSVQITQKIAERADYREQLYEVVKKK